MADPMMPAELMDGHGITLGPRIAAVMTGAVHAVMTLRDLERLPTFVTPRGRMVQGLPTEDVQPELAEFALPQNHPRREHDLPFLWIVTQEGELRQAWPMDHVTVCPKFDNATLERVGLSIEVSSEPFQALPNPTADDLIGEISPGKPAFLLESRKFNSGEMARLPPSE